jgi:hypothetical protein
MNTIMKIAILGLIITVISVPPAMALQDPYPLDGYVKYANGTVVGNANVTFTNQNTGEVIYDDSSVSGWYSGDAGNFPSGYQNGHVIQYYTVFGEYSNTTTHTIDVSAGSHTMDIILGIPSGDVQPPTNLQHTTGNFWVRHSWTAGANTDSFNVSVNGVWHNATINLYYDNTGMSAHAWSNISVAGYNVTTGNLSASISQNTQIPNNPITITNTGDWSGEVGDTVSVDYNAVDADSDTATFSCSRTDLFTDFNTATGAGTWTPPSYGSYSVTFGVSDGHGSSDSYAMTITVTHFSVGLTARASGTDGNSIVTTETCGNASFAASTLSGGRASEITGEWADSDAPTASGLWGDVGGMVVIALIIGVVAIIIMYLRRGTE